MARRRRKLFLVLLQLPLLIVIQASPVSIHLFPVRMRLP
ncbi:hypothetical protein NAL19_1888 [Pectobacterium sp. F1-1]|nr:hypothetical protein NAL19_1888 [Pectobacterium sp. F1-1]